jgi:hypothetical protein
MQKRHAIGFFLDSSYRKSRALKSLLHKMSQEKEEEEKGSGDIYQYPIDPDFPARARDMRIENPRDQMKRAVRI